MTMTTGAPASPPARLTVTLDPIHVLLMGQALRVLRSPPLACSEDKPDLDELERRLHAAYDAWATGLGEVLEVVAAKRESRAMPPIPPAAVDAQPIHKTLGQLAWITDALLYSTICIVPGCGKRRTGRGLCAAHYTKARYNINLKRTTWDELITKHEALPIIGRCCLVQKDGHAAGAD